VVSPSLIKTMRAGTGSSSSAGGAASIASSDAKIASPMAVRSPRRNLVDGARSSSRSWVGATRTTAVPLK
jgi:hypothetical protein